MKKTVLAMAVVAMSMVAVPAFAQKSDNCPKVCTEQCAAGPGCKQQCPDAGCNRQKCAKAPKGACAFEGLNLTDAQKQKLMEIKKPGVRVAEQQKAERAERVNRAKAARQAYLADVKAVLTPQQYIQFLENNYINSAPKHRPGKNQKAVHQPNRSKKAAKDNRPQGPSVNAKGKRSSDN